jgi:HK97 family phage major capsid protein
MNNKYAPIFVRDTWDFNACHVFPQISMDDTKYEIDEDVITAISDRVLEKMKDGGDKDDGDDPGDKDKPDKKILREIEVGIEKGLETALGKLDLDNKKTPALNRIKSLGYEPDDGPMDAMNEYFKNGDRSDDLEDYEVEKAAMQEGTDSEGGYATIVGMNNMMWEYRDEVSFIRQAGIVPLKVDHSTFNFPLENTRLTDWVITAEEGAVDQDEGDMGQLATTQYNFTKLHKISKQLLRFDKVDLVGYISRRLGRSWGLTENKYAMVGTGSGQPQGLFIGGTADTVLASLAAITAAEIQGLFYSVPQQYRKQKGMFVFSNPATNELIRGLTGDPFSFAETPLGKILGLETEQLMGKPAIEDSNVAVFAANAKVLGMGSVPDALAVAEASGMIVSRNNQLYEANQQVGIFANKWWTCGVGNAEAFRWSPAAAA